MANDYYNKSGTPATGSFGSSSSIRAEFILLEDGFNKNAPLTGNGGKIIAVNSGGTAQEAIATTGTGDGVRANSPSLNAAILQSSVWSGFRYLAQGALASYAAAATLTALDIIDSSIVRYTGAAATLTLPTGADLAAGASALLITNRGFDFSIINTGSGTVTLANGASGWGAGIGAFTVVAGASAIFRVRCTGVATYVVYRIA